MGQAAPGQDAGPPLLKGSGQVSFESLGWNDDFLLTEDSERPVVKFRLPEDVTQGDPLWYGVELAYEWSGTPGPPGDYAFLHGRWNGKAFYHLKAKRVSDLDGGFEWSMVDMVNGSSHGYETGDRFAARSTNFAQIDSVQPGVNELPFALGLLNASSPNISGAAQEGLAGRGHRYATNLHPS